ncbi:type II toxin-antitoxin system HicA family toxin [Chitiniphilus purpureus]|uniref:Type II toxin-antitoxin system HicA family toxin n=1 Tax=Chitiniphilus purpureus TaxID=2981137 RepID=A0ABY6DQQ1_9NEIS|nr:type II toxin-antitoxin system HicA family toxin [Chitiniphilus sp. CD1]UXY16704.1 type II toxin-antitoxin system HicA family toxin [Chitiniphilus sp. CD1]
MTKNDKRLQRLKTIPADYHWDELRALLESLDWTLVQSGGGSHCFFEHVSGRRLNTYRPHPGGIMKRYQLKEVVALLDEMGV